jgi:hypothetical protein
MTNQMGGRLGHTAGATGRAKPSPFTGERHQFLMGTFPAPQAQKPMR